MENYTAKLLGLEDVIVKKVWDEGQERHIHVVLPVKEHKCPCCGEVTSKIHDYRWQKVKDCPAFGKRVILHLHKRRYVCEHCGKRFFEKNEFLPRYHRMTNRKTAQIIDDFRRLIPAAQIARDHGISVPTAFRRLNLLSYSCKQLPEVLSIDEFKGDAGGEKYQTILTDAREKRIIDILPDRKKTTLMRYFLRFKDRKQVKYVVMDMNQHFRDVIETCFPHATIVIDRYHVSRQALWALERVRKAEQKKLPYEWRKFCKRSRALLMKSPGKLNEEEKMKLHIILGLSARVEQAYYLKNEFLRVMHARSSEEAREGMSKWLMCAEASGMQEFSECTRAIHNWGKLILNSFDCRYTNGYTEGCNNKTKVLKRVSYGIRSFRHLRTRILHAAT